MGREGRFGVCDLPIRRRRLEHRKLRKTAILESAEICRVICRGGSLAGGNELRLHWRARMVQNYTGVGDFDLCRWIH